VHAPFRWVAIASIFVALLTSATAHADELAPPRLERRSPPTYPEQAQRDRIEGVVVVEVSIDATGRVTGARVTKPLGHGLDEAALAAARTSVFSPATRNGAPISATIELTIPFQLPPPQPAPPKEVVQTGPEQQTVVIAERPIVPNSIQGPEPAAASDSSTAHSELMLRPRYRTEQIVEAVPGLFAVQHAGGGKADQYFMRGFDLDHGTDLAYFVDGAPINAVSHGHGQGYSDLHFIIPETIGIVESTKGPYSARVGDFATAG